MTTFLELVAQSLLQRFGNDMSHVIVVFPGKRASLFFNQALVECSDTPVWTPTYTTIRDLFQQMSPYIQCDTIEAVCRLYDAYVQVVDEPQTLDLFYGWGEILLSDFDDVDKHLADAHQLFANIHDIKALDDSSYITAEQEAALKAFFSDFSLAGNTLLKERFLNLWNRMSTIYDILNTAMREDGVLYEGALQREVVMRLKQSDVIKEGMTYVFVGFNVLNDVEQALFDELQRRSQALFFWDYDTMYAGRQGCEGSEAGFFIHRNIERYGNELTPENFDNMRKPKELTIIATSSENAQARYLPQWLQTHLTNPESRTAIVLANEQLLLPILFSIPDDVQALNVTMGYPLPDTPVCSFVSLLMTLQIEGYDARNHRFRAKAQRAVARHPFSSYLNEKQWLRHVGCGTELLAYICELLMAVGHFFTQESSKANAESGDMEASNANILYTEAIFKAYTSLNRLADLMSGPRPLLKVNDHTLQRIVMTVLQAQTVPFHGEPAEGLQVMGVLETRAMDFDHVLMLSVGEGFMPKSVAESSFIPYQLKEAFGLTTIRHKMAVYAYYFYRLIQRAGHVTFMYNDSNAGTRQNEISRFLRQLEAETDFPIDHRRMQADNDVPKSSEIIVDKIPAVMQVLLSRYDCSQLSPEDYDSHLLSPSALNSYTTCPMQFYYHYVKHLSKEELNEDGFEAKDFGTIFHRAAELLYKHLMKHDSLIRQHDIDVLLEQGTPALDAFVHQAFCDAFFKERAAEYTGILVIARRVILTYLQQLLRYDRSICPIRILGLEKKVTAVYNVNVDGHEVQLCVGGIIDRLDQVSDVASEDGRLVRVVDYKTGGRPSPVNETEVLFNETGQNAHYIFQSLLYATIVAAQRHEATAPCLFYVHQSGAADYSPKIKIAKHIVNDIREPLTDGEPSLQVIFQERLLELLKDIFNPNIPFKQTADVSACNHCFYKVLCGR